MSGTLDYALHEMSVFKEYPFKRRFEKSDELITNVLPEALAE